MNWGLITSYIYSITLPAVRRARSVVLRRRTPRSTVQDGPSSALPVRPAIQCAFVVRRWQPADLDHVLRSVGRVLFRVPAVSPFFQPAEPSISHEMLFVRDRVVTWGLL